MDRLEQSLRRQLARLGSPASTAELAGVWPELVGEAIAANAWPAHIARDGTLHVNTADSVWAFELSQSAPAILDRIRARLGADAPRALRFRVGLIPDSIPAPEGAAAAPPARIVPSDECLRASAKLAAEIEDVELRARVARAVALSLARAASDRGF